MILDFKFQSYGADPQLKTCNPAKAIFMKRKWITKEGSRVLTLFFCGWGMDERAVQHVKGTGDLLLFYDYRDISGEEAPEVAGYERGLVDGRVGGIGIVGALEYPCFLPGSYQWDRTSGR